VEETEFDGLTRVARVILATLQIWNKS